jgi:hypothetical protein
MQNLSKAIVQNNSKMKITADGLIKKYITSIKTPEAKEVGRIFRQHKMHLENLLEDDPKIKFSFEGLIRMIILNEYSNFPMPDAIDAVCSGIKDRRPDIADELHFKYWDAQECLNQLSRTDLNKKDMLGYFLRVHEDYNTVQRLGAEVNALLKKEGLSKPYDIA